MAAANNNAARHQHAEYEAALDARDAVDEGDAVAVDAAEARVDAAWARVPAGQQAARRNAAQVAYAAAVAEMEAMRAANPNDPALRGVMARMAEQRVAAFP